jgi:hypothetical protein
MDLKTHQRSLRARTPVAALAERGKKTWASSASTVKPSRKTSPPSSASATDSARPTLPRDDRKRWSPAAGEVGIRVRMYRVGFGDFFLITLLAEDQPLHIVIDCGVFKGTSQSGDINSIEAAVADMAQITDGRVPLIVMTHRHADHIAGFARCADTFESLQVDAVWMPVWESEYEPVALKFQAELTRTALALRQHFTAFGAGASEAQNTARKYMENATGEFGAAGAAAEGSNAKALELLKHGLKGVTPQYFKAGDTATLPKALSDGGLTCQILGPPPVEDMALMKLMDLQKGIGQYLTGDGTKEADAVPPFAPEWEIDPGSQPSAGQTEFYTSDSFTEFCQDRGKSKYAITMEQTLQARQAMEDVLKRSQPIAALTAAKQLNAFLNNQSLVILFTFKGKNLLFVGDAQAGNWEHWLFATDAADKNASGTMSKAAQQILTNLDFYKVGHHGSGNATPKAAAEMMGSRARKFAAMCSTQKDVYGTENPDDPTKGTEVPRVPLLAKLASESAFVRSDQIEISVEGRRIEAAAPASLPAAQPGCRFEQGPLWVDCFL